MKLIIATSNEGKMREIRDLFEGTDFELYSLKDLGIHTDIEENGATFMENAAIKALEIHKLTGGYVLADDSGLEVDYLDKAPGIYSARFLGEDTSYDIKNKYILDKLEGVPKEKRTARFVCAMVCVTPDGRQLETLETAEGFVAQSISGVNGFGYDPIFFDDGFGCTFAELPEHTKNEVSHRGKALRAMRQKLAECL